MSSTEGAGQRTNGMKDYEAALDEIAARIERASAHAVALNQFLAELDRA